MRTVEDQLQRILAPLRPLEPLELPLQDARGCVLAADISAQYPIPAFDTACIDGYAARSIDLSDATRSAPVLLTVSAQSAPGYQSSSAVGGEAAVRVSAGSRLPEGADVIIPSRQVTKTMPGSSELQIRDRLSSGSGVRRTGTDVAAGDVVLGRGTELGELEVAAVVAAGRSRVRVYPHPRVVIITIGDSLVDPGTAAGSGQVFDVNAATLVAAANAAGAVAFRGGSAPEDPAAITRAVEDQLVRADLIVITGGSQADGDQADGPVADGLKELGTVDFRATAIEPGPAIGYGNLGHADVPVIAIPGDPAGAMIAFEIFVRPVIRMLSGRENAFRSVVRATLTQNVSSPEGVRSYLPAVMALDGNQVQITPLSAEMSTSPVWLRKANAIAIIDEKSTDLLAGVQVGAIRLDR